MLVAAVLLLLSVGYAQTADPATRADRYLYLPPSWADRVVFYQGFDEALDRAEIDGIAAKVTAAPTAGVAGLGGLGCAGGLGADGKKGYEITSEGLSPHRPLTMMCWVRLDAEPAETTWYNLLRLWQGNTYITHFVAGKGEWCALQRPTCIYQVVNFPGIPLYSNSWGGKPTWQPGEWHHVAMTVVSGSKVRFYRDGVMTEDILVKTRPFREGEVKTATFGDGGLAMTIDEVIVADRALTDGELADYVRDTRLLHEIRYPALGPPGQ